ncbi:hypothetical protein DVH05_022530 [Phytophthora capsici]|nr:hypothetical protein DVH05_022530 [Phytophthora capsici]
METEQRRRHDEASGVPIAVIEAIQPIVPGAGTKVIPARPSETSFEYDWGTRVIGMTDESANAIWICFASETCRTHRAKMLMSGGQTSKATRHLRKAHGIGSDKIPVRWVRSELVKKNTQYCGGAHCIEMIPVGRTS